jgi:hypothetical protein
MKTPVPFTQGETTDAKSFDIPSHANALVFNVVYPGSQIDLLLKDGQGKLVDEAYKGATITVERGLVVVTVKEPRAGRWSYMLYGSDIPAGGEPYYVAASTRQSESQGGVSKTTWILVGVGLLCCCGASVGGVVAGLWYVRRKRVKGQ